MASKPRLLAAGIAAAALVPFGLGLLTHAMPVKAPDLLACIVGGASGGPQASEDRYSGGLDDASPVAAELEPPAHVTEVF